MKKQLPFLFAIITAACLRAADPVVPPTVDPEPKPAPVVVAVDPFAEVTTVLQQVTFEKHDGLSAVGDRMNRAITDQVLAWKTAGHPTSTPAEDKLTAARDDFTEKLRQLSLSTVETWASAKSNAMDALKSVQVAYNAIASAPAKI